MVVQRLINPTWDRELIVLHGKKTVVLEWKNKDYHIVDEGILRKVKPNWKVEGREI